jgi:hypothetical protein
MGRKVCSAQQGRGGERGAKRAEEREIERGESGASTVLLCGGRGRGPSVRFDGRDVPSWNGGGGFFPCDGSAPASGRWVGGEEISLSMLNYGAKLDCKWLLLTVAGSAVKCWEGLTRSIWKD